MRSRTVQPIRNNGRKRATPPGRGGSDGSSIEARRKRPDATRPMQSVPHSPPPAEKKAGKNTWVKKGIRYFDYDLERMQAADEETLSAIPGVGEVLASTFTDYMRDAENLEKIAHLKEILTIETPQIDESAQTLAGMSFVVTGSLNHYASRNDLKEVIEEKGGKVTGSVTGKTTCLINNDITSTSSKNKKAKELQVPILTEEEFLRTYNIPYEE